MFDLVRKNLQTLVRLSIPTITKILLLPQWLVVIGNKVTSIEVQAPTVANECAQRNNVKSKCLLQMPTSFDQNGVSPCLGNSLDNICSRCSWAIYFWIATATISFHSWQKSATESTQKCFQETGFCCIPLLFLSLPSLWKQSTTSATNGPGDPVLTIGPAAVVGLAMMGACSTGGRPPMVNSRIPLPVQPALFRFGGSNG